MYIEELKCPNCNRKGRPGEENFTFAGEDRNGEIRCTCGTTFSSGNMLDQMILSNNSFVRLQGLSNYSEHGTIAIIPGTVETITFKSAIDFTCLINLTATAPYL